VRIAALAAAACAAILGTPAAGAAAEGAAPPAWKWTPEAVVDTVAVGGVVIAPDGNTVVFTRSRWRAEGAKPGPAHANLWRVPFGGGEPRRLTTADAEDQRPRWSPDGSRLAFLSKRGEGETAKTRVHILPVRGGEPWALTDEKTEVASFEWSPDGRSIAYVAVDPKPEEKEKEEKAGRDAIVVDRDLRPRRLWIADAETGRAEKLASLGELSAWEFDWAPDGSAIAAAVTDLNRTDDSYMLKRIAVLPLKGERRELVPNVGKIAEIAWSRDGRTVAWLGGVDGSDPSAGSLFVVPAEGGAPRNLTGSREQTSQSIAWRRDGRIGVVNVVGARSAIALVDPAAGSWETVVAPGGAAFSSATWSEDGGRYAFAGSTSAHPTDVYAGSLPAAPPEAAGGRRGRASRAAKEGPPPPPEPPRRLVDSNPGLEALPRGAQEVVRYRAKDGLEIEGVLVKPEPFREGTRLPLIVVVHGGPESQYLDGWLNGYATPGHALAERGYVVFFPNYRGSTGRGVAFAKADHKDLGGREFTDVLDGIDHLAWRGIVDPNRVGITGGSYGGYFTALGVTRYSDRFAAGVELFGITSWESFLGQSDIPVESSMVHWNLWCYDHADLCRERSAIGNLDRAGTPTLILQGEKDDRVPKPQSDELYAALKWRKVPVEYVVYPREPHGFRERWHRLDCLTRLLGWMDRYVQGMP
jgi:dipeptidyl aminopeptidase/acylaminoacyl peptidase